MTDQFTIITALQEPLDVPTDSIVSRTVYNGEGVRIVLFAFAAGQELTEHTSTREALIHVLDGDAVITLGEETVVARAGMLIRMAPNLPHSVLAQSPVRMLLYMLGK
ncbi:MAG: cupin domain-containing protein [Caldilinea sp.]